eukprot:12936199-Prorocentrum_lima.AAC.1
MKRVKSTQSTKNLGTVMKIPTMLQHRNGIQGKEVNGIKKTLKATMRKMQRMKKKTNKKLIKRTLKMWMVQ